MNLVMRTSTGPWPLGWVQNANLTAEEIDFNFWLLYSMIVAVQDHGDDGDDIDYFSVQGSSFFVHMLDHRVLGPYPLPVAQWNFRGEWAPFTAYNVFDVVTDNGAVYLITFGHISAASFDPGANDGLGHNFYGLLLAQPEDELPTNGTDGQFLQLTAIDSSGDPETQWTTLTRNLALYIEGQPAANEVVLRYVSPETFTLPLSLDDSVAAQLVETETVVVYSLFQNGNPIGSITFSPSPGGATFQFTAPITFHPGDVLQIVGPPVPDAAQSGISITLVAQLGAQLT